MNKFELIVISLIVVMFFLFMTLLAVYPSPSERKFNHCIDKTANANACQIISHN